MKKKPESETKKDADVMTAQEVCDLLQISHMTLHRRIRDGKLTPLPKNPAHLRHYRLLFRRSDIQALLSQ